MYDEVKFITDSFRKNFKRYLKEEIAIYGLGKNTKLILEECKEFHIAGLMDGVRTGEEVWGLPVFSYEEVVQRGIKVIVIVAAGINVPVIYQRIAGECKKHEIKVFDINGNDLSVEAGVYELPEYYEHVEQGRLLEVLKQCDVISFDIFDTLLVRNVLYPTDIFIAVEERCAELLSKAHGFYENRIKAERELHLNGNPTIHDIYEILRGQMGISEETAEVLKTAELAAEKEALQKREQMAEILGIARKMGKVICCTSDMYMTSDMLAEILEEKGITGIDRIFVSCEYNTSKSVGLFQAVKSWYPGKRILHIGDNREVDIAGAERNGIEETFWIPSVYQMALDSKFRFILGKCGSYVDRCVLGEVLSHCLNDPFLFGKTKGKAKTDSSYEAGYYFLEPFLEIFIKWMMQACMKDRIDYLLLGARDGWIIREVLDLESAAGNWDIPYLYFYSSRMSCTMAGMWGKQDVLYVRDQAFDGTVAEKLKKRFGLKKEELLNHREGESEEAYFERHIPLILDSAKGARERYERYIERLGIRGDRIGFMDFVASGTCQLWLNRIMEKELTGYYVARNLEQYKAKLQIRSMYEPKFVYEKKGELDRNLMFLETVFTSMEPSLKGFDENGECVYAEETRTTDKLESLTELHRGMLDRYRERMDGKSVDELTLAFAESMISLLRDEYMIWENSYYEQNELTEEFCNRKIDIRQRMKDN